MHFILYIVLECEVGIIFSISVDELIPVLYFRGLNTHNDILNNDLQTREQECGRARISTNSIFASDMCSKQSL